MNKINKKSLAVGVLLGTVVAVSGVTFASNNQDRGLMDKDGCERHGEHKVLSGEAKKALESGNYNNFKSALEGDERGEKITEDRFKIMVALHKAKESGNEEQVKELRNKMRRLGGEHKSERKGQREEVKKAVEDGNYEKFSELTKDREKQVTEDVFNKIRALHAAKESGDRETFEEIKGELSDLGFEKIGHGERREKGERRMNKRDF